LELELVKLFPAVLFFGLLILELLTGHLSRQRGNWQEVIIAWGSYIQQFAVIRPVIAFTLAGVAGLIFPASADSLSHLPFWPVFFVYLFTRELMQYWYHRFSHEWPWLWALHKTHHSAEQMNVLVGSRGNVFWFLLMPTLYFEAWMIYIGLTEPYLLAYAILAFVSISSHSGLRWDLPLFHHRLTAPIMRKLQFFVTTPDTHHAHHGVGGEKANPNGNYAPLFFFYDVLFGTAKNPIARQDSVGIEVGGDLPWYRQLLSPRG
jgi:sterol desaturase/sphingolipid hydroxylase (fatty acid hydroxylase superfamily)